jgi:hypothetical protein
MKLLLLVTLPVVLVVIILVLVVLDVTECGRARRRPCGCSSV